MTLPKELSRQLCGLIFGPNWTERSLLEVVRDVDANIALRQVSGFQPIAALTFHIGYFIEAVIPVFEGKELTSRDALSFDHPPLASEDDWHELQQRIAEQAKQLCYHLDQMAEEQLWEDFVDAKYGSYYENIQGIIHHGYYHLGQIVVVKKLIEEKD